MTKDREFLVWLHGYLSAFQPVDFKKDNFITIRDKIDRHLKEMEEKENGYKDVRD